MTTISDLDRLVDLRGNCKTEEDWVEYRTLYKKLSSQLNDAAKDKETLELGKRVLEVYSAMLADYEKSAPYEKDFVDLFLDRIVKGVCDDCGETKPCTKHYRPEDVSWYANSHKFVEQRLTEFRDLKSKLANADKNEQIVQRLREATQLLYQKPTKFQSLSLNTLKSILEKKE